MLSLIDAALSYAYAGANIGVGLIAIGAGLGIGKVGNAAMKAISRQPEATSKIQTAMIIACALVEGIALFGTLICLLTVIK